MPTPHDTFKYTRPDEVAECFEGVTDDLYTALWNSMDGMKPLNEMIDMEESGPGDAVGLNTLASVWSKFTEAQQTRLNEIAAAHAAEWGMDA